MKFIDTHTHIYLLDEFENRNNEIALRAIESGVSHMILPNVDCSTVEQMKQLHKAFPLNTSMALGLHPTEVKESWQTDLDRIYSEFENCHFAAVGEIGIDMYWDTTFRNEQMQALDTQLHWAEEKNLPAIIHCRDGINEIIEVLSHFSGEIPSLVFHSFSGNGENVRRLREYGDFFFGINGVVTFKNAQTLRDALPEIGMERILLETDSPYLAPVPYRGKRNESAYIPIIASKIGEVFNIEKEEVAKITTTNATQFFNLPIGL